MIGIGTTKKAAKIVADIGESWIETVLSAESISSFEPVSEANTFDLEYWSLEQAKISKQKYNKFTGKIVLVTGAAGSIGAQISKDFKENGAEVILLDISEKRLLKTASDFDSEVKFYKCDLTNKSDIEETFKKIIIDFGGIDIIVSNAGAAFECDLEKLDIKLFEKSMKINLFSHHHISQEAIKIFKAQDYKEKKEKNKLGGQLLFNISKQALNPGPNFGSYGIAKAALLALMKQYALEAAGSKIRSNGINADRIKSGLLDEELIKKRAKSRGVSEDQYMRGNLLKAEVKPKDVSNAFISLALMEKTTGAILTVDGGNVAAMVR
ncbi:SDR family oxidoreductase [Prochlorococcus sp. AH-736-L17]|nr:SDR family oxidoreductase [Prochlorococcus sp. AH-736-L17]